MKRILSALLAGAAILSCIVLAAPQTGAVYKTESGLVLSDWALNDGSFHDADQYGILNRYHYNQDYTEPITRQEFADYLFHTVSGILCGTSEIDMGQPEPFTDTDRNSIYCLAQLGIAQGVVDGKFDPGATLTREQAATFLARAGEVLDFTFLPRSSEPFTDAGDISEWAEDAVAAMQSAGLMIGTETGAFLPKNQLTKEQAAAMLVRFRAKNGVNGWLVVPKKPEDVTLAYFETLNGKCRPTGEDSYEVTYRQDCFASITLQVVAGKVTEAVYTRLGNGRQIDLLDPQHEEISAFPDYPILWTYLGGTAYEKSDLEAKTESLIVDGQTVMTLSGDEVYSFSCQKLCGSYVAGALRKDGTTTFYSLPDAKPLFTVKGLLHGIDHKYIYTEETRYSGPTVDAAYDVYAVYTHDGTPVAPMGLSQRDLYERDYYDN